MTRLIIQDTSTATVDGLTITGPIQMDVDACTVDAVEYTGGTVLVVAGEGYQVAGMAREHVTAMPYAMYGAFVVGVAMAFFKK